MELVVILTRDETMVFEELDNTDVEYINLLDRLQRFTARAATITEKTLRIIGTDDEGNLYEMVVPDSQG